MSDATAAELIESVKEATEAEATEVINTENQRDKGPRVTVVQAAEARLAELASPGEALEAIPEGAWAWLVDPDTGEPVTDNGNPVATELVE
jgi:hypothetical protein